MYDHTKVEPRKWNEISPLTNTLIVGKSHSTRKKAGSIQRTGCMLPACMGWDLASLRRGLGRGGDEASPWGRLGRSPRSGGRRRRDARSRGGAPA